MSDFINIKGLRLVTKIGVPEEERAIPQSLKVDVAIKLSSIVEEVDDRLDLTIDYYRVSQRLREVASSGERKLIETLAEELAAAVLAFDGVFEVTIELQKFILADCESVSVVLTRSRD
ncbi:MAG: dihydroneopterin aldolase [Verrucomicrobiales bacterium]|nr:dihydroneopterin aldolase [Verrucomicrobiales bacterium]HAT60060.1 dihydroneopterin aldolase [Opitutae bacterium]|tara:strand:- start:2001 stop:2354 length:354 start_codon:yes stop_codon:yes gene_type:complete